MRRPLLLSAGLLGIAIVAGIAVWQLRPKPRPPAASTARSDYILENFQLTSLDSEGKESFSVSAPYLERDPGGRSLSMRLPNFSFPDRRQGRWLATSDRAWIAEKGVEVRLIDKVHMTGPPSPRGERTRFDTAHLQIFPKQDLALSEDPVTITRADSILQGTGLRADMKSHKVSLLANVKGRYAPRRP
jgi:lipopolysaccharide export system protein LptC